jgi:hypothetical protein
VPLAFDVAHCPCGAVVCDGLFTGAVRVRCRDCGKRVLVVSDGKRVRAALVDSAPKRMIA